MVAYVEVEFLRSLSLVTSAHTVVILYVGLCAVLYFKVDLNITS